jgi:predicted TIM-barrel fold metal-dependent hydrolase
VRSYQDKAFWGTTGNARHGALPEKPLDHYIDERLVFDTAGFCGAIGSINSSLVELPASRVVFATDYPQEIRERAAVKKFVDELRALGPDGEAILGGNSGLLVPGT